VVQQRIKKENKGNKERSKTIETRGEWVLVVFVCLYWKKSVGSHHTLISVICLFVFYFYFLLFIFLFLFLFLFFWVFCLLFFTWVGFFSICLPFFSLFFLLFSPFI